MPDFLLPDLGEGLTEADIVAWHVSVGDEIAVDQVVVEVETAKAAVEVPAPFAGTVAALHGEPGATLEVGAPLLRIDQPVTGEGSNPSAGWDEPGVVTGREPSHHDGSGNVLVGYGTSTTPRRRRGRRNGRTATTAAAPAGRSREADVNQVSAVISPLVRRLARERGLDVTRIRGSGEDGIVRRADVDAACAAAPSPTTEPESTTAPESTTPPEPTTAPESMTPPKSTTAPDDEPTRIDARSAEVGDRRIPLRGRRKAVADKMTLSRREIPEATVWVDADATELAALRKEINDHAPDQRVSLLSLIARFTVSALKKFPELNSRVDGDEIVLRGPVHLGVAAQTDRGLLVPVIKDAGELSARRLSEAIAVRTEAGRAGTLQPAQLTGSTFTINNYGVFGVDGSAAIINHPEAGILGIGRIIERPWIVDGELVGRSICPLTLAFDHRVCDGGTAGGFLRFIADCIEAPARALAEI
ncbi:dihydrolipoamide acetyltransferase family protein [Saccharopolyspora gloriosae]|uniref:dihydrolipoamide acetyltransferase family protein n=1 Tax=Saccharopolyspora gloriosae TaxID=455344 RepID=UPI001FB72EFE|nr:dihydrolipoamide acetyltransferase family protein [Saccharopolyspora gloriosae]